MSAEAPIILMDRECRIQTERSRMFYSTAQKLIVGVTISAVTGTAEITFGLEVGFLDATRWVNLYTAGAPVDDVQTNSYTFHDDLLPILAYSAYDSVAKLYVPTGVPMRCVLTMSGTGNVTYTVVAGDCISLRQGLDQAYEKVEQEADTPIEVVTRMIEKAA